MGVSLSKLVNNIGIALQRANAVMEEAAICPL
jgi:hypothetical protein